MKNIGKTANLFLLFKEDKWFLLFYVPGILKDILSCTYKQ